MAFFPSHISNIFCTKNKILTCISQSSTPNKTETVLFWGKNSDFFVIKDSLNKNTQGCFSPPLEILLAYPRNQTNRPDLWGRGDGHARRRPTLRHNEQAHAARPPVFHHQPRGRDGAAVWEPPSARVPERFLQPPQQPRCSEFE